MGDFFRDWKAVFALCGFLLCRVLSCFCQPSVSFIENKNQWSADVDFASRIPGGKMLIGSGSFKYYFFDYGKLERLHHNSHEADPDAMSGQAQPLRGHAVFVDFPGADASVVPQPFGKSDLYYNYFLGPDQDRWASGAHAFQGMLYQSLYPGIDLKVYGAGQNVKYDFIVAPGADPSKIRVMYQGAEQLQLDKGDLVIKTSLADIIEKRPSAWQFIHGKKVAVSCAFNLNGNMLTFSFPEGFDSCYELTVDPLLIFSTYSGSTADNWGSTATPGEHGTLYSAGVTNEAAGGTFPATPGAFQTTSAGLYDIGILKYDSLGTRLLFATYLGGSNSESPHSLVVNGAGELILLGTTSSSDYAVTVDAYSTSFKGGVSTAHVVQYSAGSDIVLSRLSSDGKALMASTFVGGTLNDGLNPSGGALTRNYGDQLRGDVITDEAGNIYVSSVTASADIFSAPMGFEPLYQGGATDAILFKMDAGLSQLLWATYIGGTGTDAAHTLKLDRADHVFVAGGTTSPDFSTTTGSYQTTYGGGVDGWIAKVASDGSALLHATFTGTSEYNQIYFLGLNESEEVYVYGQTTGTFPVSPGVYSNPGSGQFIQKFDNTLQSLGFSTVFGSGRGAPDISPTAFLVNECNNLYMAGWGGLINTENGYWSNEISSTRGMPVSPDAFQQTTSGSDFYFIVLKDDAEERLYATFLGGAQSRTHVDGGTSRFDKTGIVYHSVCSGCAAFNASTPPRATSDFPTTPGAWSRTNNSINCNNAAFKLDLSSLKARIQTNTERGDMPGINIVCIPDPIVFDNSSIGGEIFEWDFGDGTTVSTTDTTFIVHEYKTPGQYRVKLKAIDLGTCVVVDSTFTNVTVNIAQSYIQDDAEVCSGDSYQLQASGGVRYWWTSSDGTLSSQLPTPVAAPSDTTTYYLTLEEANGCVRQDTVQLNVIPAIIPEFEWHKVAECVGRPGIAVRNVTDSLKGADNLFFDFGDGSSTDLEETEHSFEKDGVYDITLVTQREFCVFEKSVSVPVFEMFIPNVITPGVAGHNDVFTIRYGTAEGVTPGDYGFNVAVTIYNRWGHIVYQSDHYQYDWSGKDLAAGVYYYEVTVEGHTTCKGSLHLLK